MFRFRVAATICVLATGWGVAARGAAPTPQAQTVDRIVARIESDIITSSEVRELAGYQELVDGHAQSDQELVSELIEQWVVSGEAAAAHFPAAAASEVDREVARIESHYNESQASGGQAASPTSPSYDQRLAELGLTRESVRRMVARQILLARYLDYKFRPAVQVEDAAVEAYYQNDLLPELAAKHEAAPPLDSVREQIHELLVQQGISERASSWVQETKSRLDIEMATDSGVKPLPTSR